MHNGEEIVTFTFPEWMFREGPNEPCPVCAHFIHIHDDAFCPICEAVCVPNPVSGDEEE